jgi:hypothetical protein
MRPRLISDRVKVSETLLGLIHLGAFRFSGLPSSYSYRWEDCASLLPAEKKCLVVLS